MPEGHDDGVLTDEDIWRDLRKNIEVKAKAEQDKDRKDFIAAWHARMVRSNELSDGFKIAYYVTLSLTALIAAAVPTLVAATGSASGTTATVLRVLAAVFGVLVAAATSIIGVVQVGNRWRVYRTYSQSLEEAGWDYLASDKDDGYADFEKAVTNARRLYGREYLNEVAILQTSGSKGNTGT